MIDTGEQATNLASKLWKARHICERNRCRAKHATMWWEPYLNPRGGKTAQHNNDNDYHQCNFYNNLVSRFPYWVECGLREWMAKRMAHSYAPRTRFGFVAFNILDANSPIRWSRRQHMWPNQIKNNFQLGPLRGGAVCGTQHQLQLHSINN